MSKDRNGLPDFSGPFQDIIISCFYQIESLDDFIQEPNQDIPSQLLMREQLFF